MVFSSLYQHSVKRLVLSYDIACQWYKNIWKRMEILPLHLRLDKIVTKTEFLVPKFHLPAHIEQCNIDFSFNLTPFIGRTDGEAPEQGWADANRLANSTSVSGPGAQRDTLDVHFQDLNWKKIVKLSKPVLPSLGRWR